VEDREKETIAGGLKIHGGLREIERREGNNPEYEKNIEKKKTGWERFDLLKKAGTQAQDAPIMPTRNISREQKISEGKPATQRDNFERISKTERASGNKITPTGVVRKAKSREIWENILFARKLMVQQEARSIIIGTGESGR